jgi:glycosyltransferase involved in cell wall biosynthesis
MKILYGVDRLEYGQGISRVVVNMAEHFYRKGLDVKILCGKSKYQTCVPVIQCGWKEFLKQSNVLNIKKIVDEEKPDIFHSHYYPMDICGSLVNSKETAHIMHAHGIAYLSLRLNAKGLLGYIRANMGEYAGLWGSKKIIAVSKFTENELLHNYKINKNKIAVIRNSIDLTRFNPSVSGDKIRKNYGINQDDILLLAVGSHNPIKGHELLIDCFRHIDKDAMRNIKLMLLGLDITKNISYVNKLLKKVKRYELSENIIFPGFIEDVSLPNYYAACDLFICTSQWESFCMPVAEAMASAKPIITFDRTALSELVIANVNGAKVDYPDINKMANKIENTISLPEKMKYFGSNSRKIAESLFDISKNMTNLKVIYDNSKK